MRLYKLQDINLEDVDLKQKYYDNFFNGRIDEAKEIIENNPQLKSKVINAEQLNKLIEFLLTEEQYYYTGVEDVLSKHISNYQISIDDLIYLNEYNSMKEYEKNNFVIYKDEIYFCKKKTSIGILPTDSTYWVKLGLKGENGYSPLGVNYKGIYDNRISYKKYDAVAFNNNLYVAKKDSLNVNPSNSDYWFLASIIEEQGIYVSEVEPSNLKTSNIWIQILE